MHLGRILPPRERSYKASKRNQTHPKESGVNKLKRARIGNRSLISGASFFLEQLAWPNTAFPALLGPAFLLGIEPLLEVSRWQFFTTMLASALAGFLTGGYLLAGVVILHFCLWHWAHSRQQGWALAISISLPLALVLLLQTERNYLTYLLSLCSALCQLLLYRTLADVSLCKLTELKEEHYSKQGADRLLAATTEWRELDQLKPLIQELSATVEQTYDVYQDIEVLSRSHPNLSESLSQRLLTASQLVHKNKLQLQNWRETQEQVLQEFIGREMVSLRTACGWVATHITYIGSKSGQQVEASIDLPDDGLLANNEQLPLASLLLVICQQGLQSLTSEHISVHFNGYVAGEGMRIIVTFAPKSDQPSGEWPELSPCNLGSAAACAERLNAICQKGVTSKGEYVYTLEIS